MATVSPANDPASSWPTALSPEAEASDVPAGSWFDRSSITADVMVTLEGVSEHDWWTYAPADRVCEFLNGIVYMPSPATREHRDDVGFWFFLLSGFATERGFGDVVLGPGVLTLAPGRNPEPDVFLVPTGEGPHVPPALLVVEVLSPSTWAHDTGRKRDAYQEAGIPEIIYVDLRGRRLLVHRRRDDLYTTEVVEHGPWSSVALPGFWIDVDWLWARPLPGRFGCLQQILAGPPA